MMIELLNYAQHAFDDLNVNDIVRLPAVQGGELVIVTETGYASMRVRYVTGPRQGEAMTIAVPRDRVFDLFTLEWVGETADVRP